MNLFETAAYAADAGGAPADAGLINLLFLGGFVLIFYFLLWRPQSKRRKEHQSLMSGLEKGDEVVTAGGIVGGVVGNQFGGGHGKTALTVAGTLLGASVGHEYNRSHYRPRSTVEHVRRCETVDRYEQQQQLVGYRVKYRYEGQIYYTETDEHPGKFIPVRVRVTPANGI